MCQIQKQCSKCDTVAHTHINNFRSFLLDKNVNNCDCDKARTTKYLLGILIHTHRHHTHSNEIRFHSLFWAFATRWVQRPIVWMVTKLSQAKPNQTNIKSHVHCPHCVTYIQYSIAQHKTMCIEMRLTIDTHLEVYVCVCAYVCACAPAQFDSFIRFTNTCIHARILFTHDVEKIISPCHHLWSKRAMRGEAIKCECRQAK